MRNLISLLLIVGLIGGAGWLYYFAPWYVDAARMEDVTGSAALTWVAYADKAKAQKTLKLEMIRRGIAEVPSPENCEFFEEGPNKVVSCEWLVDVHLPGGSARRLRFDVRNVASPDSRLVEE